MFVTHDKNCLPPWATMMDGSDGARAWSAIEQLIPRDVLILRVSPVGSRDMPTIVMLDLSATAPHIEQFVGGDVALRGGAVLSTKFARETDQWTLDPLSEIRLGVTEYENHNQNQRLVTVTRFTTAAGRTISIPYALATRPTRGKRLWRARAASTG